MWTLKETRNKYSLRTKAGPLSSVSPDSSATDSYWHAPSRVMLSLFPQPTLGNLVQKWEIKNWILAAITHSLQSISSLWLVHQVPWSHIQLQSFSQAFKDSDPLLLGYTVIQAAKGFVKDKPSFNVLPLEDSARVYVHFPGFQLLQPPGSLAHLSLEQAL